MPTESFSIDEFAQVLKDAGYQYDKLGYIQGEYCFAVDLGKQVSIRIRSSIRNNGHAAESGSDSIRLWLAYQGQSLSAKGVPTGINERYIQRVAGWQERLVTQIEKLRFFRTVLGDCQCGYPRMALVSHTAKNPGRVFTKCVKCEKWGAWLDTDMILKQAVLPIGLNDLRQRGLNFVVPFENDNGKLPMLGANVTSPMKTNDESGEKGMFVPSIGKRDDYTEARYRKEKETGRCSYCGRLVLECVCDDVPSTDKGDGNGHTANGLDHLDAHDHSTQPMEPVSTVSVGDDSLMTGLQFLTETSAMTVAPEDKPQASKPFTPSPFQEQIAGFFESGQGHGGVKAFAGCAKTTTMAFSTNRLSDKLKVWFMVFQKANQLDMAAKVPEHVEATTANAAGYRFIRNVYPQVRLEKDNKTYLLFNKRYPYNWDVKAFYPEIKKLVSYCKQTLREPNKENLDWLCERFNVITNGSAPIVYDAVAKLYQDSIDSFKEMIDYDDQILIPALGLVPVETCDFLIVDEQQDTNQAQQELYLKVGRNGRIIYVGDEFQAIMGFRGADTEAMQRFEDALHPTMFTLPICYRCPQKVIELAQTIVPQIQARDGAPLGTVEDISHSQFNAKVQPGDMVLCRLNAPLVKPALELIRNGTKAIIKGRDIGKNLMSFVNRVARKRHITTVAPLLNALTQYVETETWNLIAAHKEGQAATLQDQLDTVVALSNGIYSIEDLQQRVTKTFSDNVEGVVFSSVHKAKGLESNRVIVLNPELMPFKKATKDWEKEQEKNLQYVCWTRSKSELYFVH